MSYSLSNSTFTQYSHEAIFNYNLLMSLIEKLLSEKGKPMVVHAGYIYTRNRKIRREQSKFEIDIAQILQGHQPKPQKACYRKRDELISRLVLGYDQSQIHQYLQNISPNISL